jgi:hypothetical protein
VIIIIVISFAQITPTDMLNRDSNFRLESSTVLPLTTKGQLDVECSA